MQVDHGAISPMQTMPSMLSMIDVGAKLGTLDQQVLVSQALAREVSQPLVDLGHHKLRDVQRPQRVFTLPQ